MVVCAADDVLCPKFMKYQTCQASQGKITNACQSVACSSLSTTEKCALRMSDYTALVEATDQVRHIKRCHSITGSHVTAVASLSAVPRVAEADQAATATLLGACIRPISCFETLQNRTREYQRGLAQVLCEHISS